MDLNKDSDQSASNDVDHINIHDDDINFVKDTMTPTLCIEGEEKDKKNQDTTNTMVSIVAKTDKLGTHVYLAGAKQQHRCTKITEAIANYVSLQCGMDMRTW